MKCFIYLSQYIVVSTIEQAIQNYINKQASDKTLDTDTVYPLSMLTSNKIMNHVDSTHTLNCDNYVRSHSNSSVPIYYRYSEIV